MKTPLLVFVGLVTLAAFLGSCTVDDESRSQRILLDKNLPKQVQFVNGYSTYKFWYLKYVDKLPEDQLKIRLYSLANFKSGDNPASIAGQCKCSQKDDTLTVSMYNRQTGGGQSGYALHLQIANDEYVSSLVSWDSTSFAMNHSDIVERLTLNKTAYRKGDLVFGQIEMPMVNNEVDFVDFRCIVE